MYVAETRHAFGPHHCPDNLKYAGAIRCREHFAISESDLFTAVVALLVQLQKQSSAQIHPLVVFRTQIKNRMLIGREVSNRRYLTTIK